MWLAPLPLWPLLLPLLLAAVEVDMATAEVSTQEVEALRQLHSSTGGDSWQWRDEASNGLVWNFTRDAEGAFLEDPCSSDWRGGAAGEPAVRDIGQQHVTWAHSS